MKTNPKAANTRKANAERLVMQWNTLYPIGTPVTVSLAQGKPIQSKTLGTAAVREQTPVIAVDGIPGMVVSLYRVKPIARS